MQGFSGCSLWWITFITDMKLKLTYFQAKETLSNEAQAGSEVVSEATLKDGRQLGPRPALAGLRCAMFLARAFPMTIKTLKLFSNMSRAGENWYVQLLHLYSSCSSYPNSFHSLRMFPAACVLHLRYQLQNCHIETSSNRTFRACIL